MAKGEDTSHDESRIVDFSAHVKRKRAAEEVGNLLKEVSFQTMLNHAKAMHPANNKPVAKQPDTIKEQPSAKILQFPTNRRTDDSK